MKNLRLLDCTLRDGGSIQNLHFDQSFALNILQTLNDSNIDIIEAGFVQNNHFNINYYDNLFEKIQNKRIKTAVMIDFENCEINTVSEKNIIDGIRLMFKKHQMTEAILYAQKLSDKGYQISLNPVSATTYTKEDIINLTKFANHFNPHVVYIIDTYGLMDNKKAIEYLKYFDEHLNGEIQIGFHAHNNLQLAFSNSVQVMQNSKRNTVIDGSLNGMGKRAGNAPTELLAFYLNTNCDKKYNLSKLAQIIETQIIPLKEKYRWGYNLIHYLAAINSCHSDYVTYLKNEKSLSSEEINKILPLISEQKKLSFDENHIEELYRSVCYESK